MTEVAQLLDDLRSGKRPLAEVEKAFSERSWRPVRTQVSEDGLGDFPLENSFEEVSAAFLRGTVNSTIYDRLVQAARQAPG